MKYIITENQRDRVFQSIYTFIDNLMPKNTNIEYYYGGFTSDKHHYDSLDVADENADVLFRIYLKDYFEIKDGEPSNMILELMDRCPILSVENNYWNTLNTMAGNRWKEPMKQWIIDNYPELSDIEIKTVE